MSREDKRRQATSASKSAPRQRLSVDSADARVGRPLTPVSVAGVHRRAYRRAAYGTAAAYGGYAAYGSGYYNTVSPGYGYGGVYRPGYRAARRVAIHRARWH